MWICVSAVSVMFNSHSGSEVFVYEQIRTIMRIIVTWN